MPLQLIDIYLTGDADKLDIPLDEIKIIDRWKKTLDDNIILHRFLLSNENTEPLLECLHEQTNSLEDVRILVQDVAATLPVPEEPEEDTEDEEKAEIKSGRISREELYQDVNDSIQVTTIYYALVILSTVVAAGGMLRNNVAIVIGAMVIAPLIGPNIALALATTLGDWKLLWRAARVNISGLIVGFVLSLVAGFFLTVDPSLNEIATRTEIGLGDMVLALAAGIAGALSMTRGVSSALIGVMVAVALVPPLVASGMLLGAGHTYLAYKAGLLVITNVAAINLAGVVTFLTLGLRPLNWYEAAEAKKATVIAITLWVLLLGILVTAILFS